MGNGGSGYYPGVDPDGAGGIIVAGMVEAGKLVNKLPYAYASSTTGTTVTNSNSAHLLLDTINHVGSAFSVSPGDTAIAINEPGIYLAFADGFLHTGSISSGSITVWAGSTDKALLIAVSQGPDDLNSGASLGITMIVAPAATTVELIAAQNSSGDQSMDGDLFVIRLGDI